MREGQIEVTLSSTAAQPTLVVDDSGIGIASDDLPHIFDRYYRAYPSRSQVEGTGLALAIAKWITEIHRADLSASVGEERNGRPSGSPFDIDGRYAIPKQLGYLS
jgi:signal transduction histidine kinase